ncbi:hypothetical protein OIE67_21155 [Nonomuraea fuscirosea]|uniref:hypothetical protein n=1 Tax=Nonomuraea fuscirosea TaxID=1291556 RepID=UPI002DDB037C|nr:hypothetical protein [Nonomuraea fuscirosea]WSA57026.1 hypothetical protein OIE67_21155 [Nonomuraea fuscirosea]
MRRHFEICVFSCLADELVRGDVAAVGSEAYANWQAQLLSWEDCLPHLATYCAEVGLPATASEFVTQLKTRMKDVAAAVDAGYPDNADLLIDEQGRPSLKARKSAGHSAEALKLATAVKDRLPERSLLEILTRTTRHLRWFRHFGPLSGSEAKLADPLDMSLVLNQLRAEGQAVHRADVAIMSPYQEDNVRRFGDYIYDLDSPLEDMEVNLDFREEAEAA